MAPKNWTMQMCIAMYWIISNRRFEPKLPEQDISKMLNYKSLTLEKGLEQSLVYRKPKKKMARLTIWLVFRITRRSLIGNTCPENSNWWLDLMKALRSWNSKKSSDSWILSNFLATGLWSDDFPENYLAYLLSRWQKISTLRNRKHFSLDTILF